MVKEMIPIDETLLTTPLEPLDQVRLKGSRCRSCGEAFLGKKYNCENCQSEEMEDIVLSNKGKLDSFSAVRHRPPGDYKGPDNPFIPFPVGFIELPEGLRIISVLDCDIEKPLKKGMDFVLVVNKFYEDEEGRDVVSYKFRPVSD